ncbi:diguanylate cyclase domain-containing protein [Marinobacter zhanjiangensis]|uniref:Diguanylate cyclase n=1 Tax=Marinobacter zhanjiangensis TaxID=578215 RepID=A0ABQ3B5U9_9GAMM|nr:diguanylate cyclase [Marinobacter zhanjiangensis]GGY74814.1 diguanylate cyclase [Marinobacter zhanjiangensis]
MTPTDQPFLANFADLLLDAICVVDEEGYLRYISAAGERIFGYAPEEMVGRLIFDFVHPQDRQKTLESAARVLGGEPLLNFENRYLRKDGTVAYIMWSARWSEADGIRVGVARDVTERRHAESMRTALYAISEAATASNNLPALFERIHPVMEDLLPAGSYTLARCASDTGEIEFPFATNRLGDVVDLPFARAGSVCRRVIACRRSLLLNRAGAAGEAPFSCLGVPLDFAGGVTGALTVLSNVPGAAYSEQDRELLQFVAVQLAAAMERIALQARMSYMAQYDQLTGLPNRALFLDRLQTALARAHRQGTRLAVLFLDLNDFKTVNDRYGHSAGDQLLQAVATTLNGNLREMDTAARLGGDEFVVLLESIEQPDDARLVAEKLLASLSVPHALSEASVISVPSIGWAVYPEDGEDADRLIAHADHGMYRNKKDRR